MNLAGNEIEVPEDAPFANDELGRQNTAQKLTALLSDTSGPLVVSINGRWGSGKTTFLHMWQQMLENDRSVSSLTFNAWENDFATDPAVVFIDELSEALQENDRLGIEAEIDSQDLKEAAKQVIPFLLGSTFGPLGRSAGETAVEVANTLFEDYERAKSNIHEFKGVLREVATTIEEETQSPLFVFVDELDRCRPDFALELLERIKHLFDVEGLVFILAIDFDQLKHSIRSVYGEDMDAAGYLRRFIDLQYRLPRPEREEYVEFLCDRLGTRHVLKAGEHQRRLIDTCIYFADHFSMTLRDKEQFMSRVDLTFREIKHGDRQLPGFVWPTVPFLVALRMERRDMYKAILKSRNMDGTINYLRDICDRAEIIVSGYGQSEHRLEDTLEGVIRTMYAENAEDFRVEHRSVTNMLKLTQDNDNWEGSEAQRRQREVRFEGVHNIMSDLSESHGAGIGQILRAAVELSGRLSRFE